MSLAQHDRPLSSSPVGRFSHLLSQVSGQLAAAQGQLRHGLSDWLGTANESRTTIRRAYGDLAPVAGATEAEPTPPTIDENIIVQQPAHTLFAFWRDVENLPTLLRLLDDVEATDFRHSHWVAHSPTRGAVAWDVEIFEERDDEWIAWRSTAGDLAMTGRVLFDSLTPLRTAMHVMLDFSRADAEQADEPKALFGEDFAQHMVADLRAFKRAMETGGLLPAVGA